MLCEAICGIIVEVEGNTSKRIEGDKEDPFSRGHICPKAAAIDDVRTDPDRVTQPMRRNASGTFEPVAWEDALSEITERILAMQKKHGRSAMAVYLGNPTTHSTGALLGSLLFYRALRSRSRFSATSVDQLPHMLASLQMFGNQALLPVPDVDRTCHFMILGGNPLVSNGSLMTTGGIKPRLDAMKARGGRLVVIDPRRTETADVADEHHFIVPGSDAFLLAAMLNVIFDEKLTRTRSLAPFTRGLDELEAAVRPFTPARVENSTGIAAETIAKLARDFAGAESAACYGRVGMCTQENGSVAAWLSVALNVVTGNLDRPGGMMFPTPAIDLAALAARSGSGGSFARYKSRVRGLPEFGGELPMAAFAEEIETPGVGQIRGLFTVAGNPVLSAPNGRRIERALETLDLMVSVDIFQNETTRHAHFILPTMFGLERDHYDIAFNAFAVRNTVKYVRGIFTPAGDVREDFDLLADLAARVGLRGETVKQKVWGASAGAFRALGLRRVIDGLLRVGPYRLSVSKLLDSPHGIDLGALAPRLPALLSNKEKKIRVAPRILIDELARLDATLNQEAREVKDTLALIGRRSLRSNNSWMHNAQRLVKGPTRCTLLMHPADATARGLKTGERVRVKTRIGEVIVPLEVSSEIAPGVVSLPHGWGHDREGVKLGVARAHGGASVNDITDDAFFDTLSATAGFSGVRVDVARAN